MQRLGFEETLAELQGWLDYFVTVLVGVDAAPVALFEGAITATKDPAFIPGMQDDGSVALLVGPDSTGDRRVLMLHRKQFEMAELSEDGRVLSIRTGGAQVTVSCLAGQDE